MQNTNTQTNTNDFGFLVKETWEAIGACYKVYMVDGGIVLALQVGEEKYIKAALPDELYKAEEILKWYEVQEEDPVVYLSGVVFKDTLIATEFKIEVKREQSQTYYA